MNLLRKIINLISLLTLLVVFISCDNELTVDNTTLPAIYAYGEITTEKENILISLRKVLSLNDSYTQSGYINDSTIITVTLLGNDSIYSFSFIDSLSGAFISDKKIQGKCNETYTLKIKYKDISYTASATMPPYPDTTFYLPFYTYREAGYSTNYLFVNNFGYTLTNEWKVTTDTINIRLGYSVISVTTYKGTPVQEIASGYSCWTLGDYKLDTLELAKYGLTSAYEKYLFDTMNETEWKDNIFSTQRANISTNFSDGAVGFFATKSVRRKRMHVSELNTVFLEEKL